MSRHTTLTDEVRRIHEDAECGGWQLGKRSTRRVIVLLALMASRIESLENHVRAAERRD